MNKRQFGDPVDLPGSPFDRLTPVDPSYATLPVDRGFNWTECLAGVDQGRWYLVAFRSRRRPDADEDRLLAHDEQAFREAEARTTGLLRYFRGGLDQDRNCLSLCVWDRRRHAKRASELPSHRVASALTYEMYLWYRVERFMLVKRAGSLEPELMPVGTSPVMAGQAPSA